MLNYSQFAEVHQRGETSRGCSGVNLATPTEVIVRSDGQYIGPEQETDTVYRAET